MTNAPTTGREAVAAPIDPAVLTVDARGFSTVLARHPRVDNPSPAILTVLAPLVSSHRVSEIVELCLVYYCTGLLPRELHQFVSDLAPVAADPWHRSGNDARLLLQLPVELGRLAFNALHMAQGHRAITLDVWRHAKSLMRQNETADAVGALVNAPSAAATCSNANDPTTLEDARIGSLWTRGTAFRFFHSMRFKLPSSRSWWYQPWDHTNDALKKRCVDIVASYDGRAPPVYATLITATRLAPGVMWLHAKVQGNANVTVAREVMLLPLDSVATVLSGCPTIGARVPRLLSMSHDREIVVQMCNPTPDTVSLPAGLPLGRVLFNPPSNNEDSAVASFLSDAANDVAPSRRADLREQVLERLVLFARNGMDGIQQEYGMRSQRRRELFQVIDQRRELFQDARPPSVQRMPVAQPLAEQSRTLDARYRSACGGPSAPPRGSVTPLPRPRHSQQGSTTVPRAPQVSPPASPPPSPPASEHGDDSEAEQGGVPAPAQPDDEDFTEAMESSPEEVVPAVDVTVLHDDTTSDAGSLPASTPLETPMPPAPPPTFTNTSTNPADPSLYTQGGTASGAYAPLPSSSSPQASSLSSISWRRGEPAAPLFDDVSISSLRATALSYAVLVDEYLETVVDAEYAHLLTSFQQMQEELSQEVAHQTREVEEAQAMAADLTAAAADANDRAAASKADSAEAAHDLSSLNSESSLLKRAQTGLRKKNADYEKSMELTALATQEMKAQVESLSSALASAQTELRVVQQSRDDAVTAVEVRERALGERNHHLQRELDGNAREIDALQQAAVV